jgi:hypothetical protein
MRTPQRRFDSRGASVLAALVIVAVLGVAALVLQYAKTTTFASMNQQAQTADVSVGANLGAQPVPTIDQNTCPAFGSTDRTDTTAPDQNVYDTCFLGQVHTVDLKSGDPEDKTANCYTLPDPKQNPPPKDPKACVVNEKDRSNPACQVARPDKCVVRYCPGTDLAKAGTCIVINCGKVSAQDCLAGSQYTLRSAGASALIAKTMYYDNYNGQQTSAVITKPDGTVDGSSILTDALTPQGKANVASSIEARVTPGDQTADAKSLQTLAQSVLAGKEAPCYSDIACTPTFTPNADLLKVATIETPPNPNNPYGDRLDPKDTTPAKSSITPTPGSDTTFGCKDPNGCDYGGGSDKTSTKPGTYKGTPSTSASTGNDWLTKIGAFAGGFMKGLGGLGGLGSGVNNGVAPPGNTTPQAPGTCSTSYTCGNNTLYYQQNNCVQQPMQYCQYGCSANACAPSQQQQAPYGVGTDGKACTQPQTQPEASTCTSGSWKAQSANGCSNTSWQCVPSTPSAPTAQLSCQPQTADVGMSLALTFGCQNATTATGSGFDTQGNLSGSAAITLAAPPAGTNTATYSLTCDNQGTKASAQCSVQVNKATIVLVANPSAVASAASATIGWVTTGMQSCVISSADLPDFTSSNAGKTSVNGVAQTPALTSNAQFLLHCQTLGGSTKDATTSVTIRS